jgi:hypothetical protein
MVLLLNLRDFYKHRTNTEISTQGKMMVLHVQLSTNCGLGCFRNKIKCFFELAANFLIDWQLHVEISLIKGSG